MGWTLAGGDVTVPLRLSKTVCSPGASVTATAFLSGGAAPYEYRILLNDKTLADGFLQAPEGWVDQEFPIPDGTKPGRYSIRLQANDSAGLALGSSTMIEVAAGTEGD